MTPRRALGDITNHRGDTGTNHALKSTQKAGLNSTQKLLIKTPVVKLHAGVFMGTDLEKPLSVTTGPQVTTQNLTMDAGDTEDVEFSFGGFGSSPVYEGGVDLQAVSQALRNRPWKTVT
jgi:hypothetical protein